MYRLNRVLGGALLASALLGSQTVRADDEKPVNLVIKHKVGRVVRMKSVITATVMGMDLVVNDSQLESVKEIKDNGDVVLETTDEGGTVNIGGMEQNQPASPTYTTVHDKLGKILEFKKDMPDGFMSPEVNKLLDSASAFILTDKPVKTNDTWQTELDNPAVKEKKVTVKDTYLGMEKIDGKDYWKVKQTAEAVVDPDGSKVTLVATEWINPTDGETYKIEATVKDLPTQIGPLTMQMTSKSSKVDAKDKPADAKDKPADAKDKPAVAKP